MDEYYRALFDEDVISDWHMEAGERAAFLYLLQHLKPDVSIEIGTFRAGSLRPIAKYSKRAYTFDIDAGQHRIRPLFPKVEFITGNSAEFLPPLIAKLNGSRDELGFVLVDGDHSTEGVRADLNAVLAYRPKTKPLVIVMHDSTNPDVRRGVLAADWNGSPYVHYLDVDFTRGVLSNRPDIEGQMWGGLAVALLMPKKREGNVSIVQTFSHSFSTLLEQSAHRN